MQTKPGAVGKKKHINVITLGCSKNLVDSERLITQLQGSGVSVSHEADYGAEDIVVVNTCGFIDRAKEESVNMILEQVARKSRGEVEKVYVTGCLSERYKDDLALEIPEVDAYFGTRDLEALTQTLGADYKHELLGERHTVTEAHYAYLKIAEGCNRPCSFCAIPLMRGKHQSRTIEQLVAETQFLVSKGVREIMLIAQDLTYYGIDLYGKRKLNDLLQRLSDVEGLEWLRLHYAYPSGFPLDILPVMRDRDNICNYLDIPLQHISDSVLRHMRRGINKQKTLELMDTIRSQVPEIALRSTFLVGHPGETESDHQELLEFIAKYKLDRIGVFTYSHEEKTYAGDTMEDTVPEEDKIRRKNEVMELQQDISLELNRKKIGQTLKVVIDRQEHSTFIGRTEYDSPEVDNEILLQGVGLQTGKFYMARVTDAMEYDLIGEVV